MAKAEKKAPRRRNVRGQTGEGPTAEELAQLQEIAEQGLAQQEAEEAARAVTAPEAIPEQPGSRAAADEAAIHGEAVSGMTAEQREAFEERREEVEAVLDAATGEPVTFLVCQCRSADWTVQKTSATAITLKCAKCGTKASVKAGVASARVPPGLVPAAISDHLTRPAPPPPRASAPEPTAGEDETEAPEEKRSTLRFGITAGQEEVIQRALEAERVLNHRDPEFRSQEWQGLALEHICADFLSGADPRALEVVDAVEARLAEEADRWRAQGEKISAKRARALRSQTRDALADKLFPERAPLVEAPHETDDLVAAREARAAEAAERAAAVDDERPLDAGRLLRAIREAMRAYAEEDPRKDGERYQYQIGEAKHYRDMVRHWEERGGHLIVARGDPRTRNEAGATPQAWIWIQTEIETATLACDAEYADLVDDLADPTLDLVELLPAGYAKLAAEEQWEAPTFTTGREEMEP